MAQPQQQQQPKLEINLILTIDEVNGVIATLAQLPFSQVHLLLDKIRNQAIVQVQKAEAEAQQAEKSDDDTVVVDTKK